MPTTHARPDAADPVSAASEAALWQRWREQRDESARQRLMAHFIPYARVVAATYYGRRINDEIEFNDYLQLASVGMVESIDRYDPALGAQFKTFAARRMHGAILNGLEQLTEKQQQIAVTRRVRKERLQDIADAASRARAEVPAGKDAKASHADSLFKYLSEVGIGLAISYLLEGTGMVESDASATPQADAYYQRTELKQLQQRIRELVQRLSDQERTVISYHYLQEHSFEEIAERLQLTRGRISQIHRKALGTLRTQLGPQSPHAPIDL